MLAMRAWLAVWLAVCWLAVLGVAQGTAPAPPAPPNVLFIAIDVRLHQRAIQFVAAGKLLTPCWDMP